MGLFGERRRARLEDRDAGTPRQGPCDRRSAPGIAPPTRRLWYLLSPCSGSISEKPSSSSSSCSAFYSRHTAAARGRSSKHGCADVLDESYVARGVLVTNTQTIVVSASSPLASSLKLALQDLAPTRLVPFAALLEHVERQPPELLVFETAAAPPALARRLREVPEAVAIIAIGGLDTPRPNVYLLRTEASVAEVARVGGALLRGELVEPASVAASPTQTALPRPSQPSPAVGSMPAPLLASSTPPSSQPSSPRPPRPGSPLARGSLEEAASQLELSTEVRQLLADAERRVSAHSRRAPSPSPPPPAVAASFSPSPEMLAALDAPIEGRDAGGSDTGSSDRPPSQGSNRQRGLASQVPTGPGVSSLPPSGKATRLPELTPTSAPFTGVTHSSGAPTRDFGAGSGAAPSSPVPPASPSSPLPPAEPPEAATTRPPAAGTAFDAQVVPAAPPLPKGSWVERALGNGESETAESSEPGVDSQPGSAAPESTVPPLEDSTSPPRAPSLASDLPPLGEGDSVRLVARAIRRRFSGAIAFETPRGMRRLVMRDGDFVTAASSLREEALLPYLVRRGTLSPALEAQLGHKLPNFGRHAGAALIAAGHLAQDQLWPVLRAHAEDIIANILCQSEGVAAFEETVPERLSAEPAVFGGATGSEVLIELLRRVLSPEQAIERLGGLDRELHPGSAHRLLEECALTSAEQRALDWILQRPLSEALSQAPSPEFPCVLYGLTELGVLQSRASAVKVRPPRHAVDDPLDIQAARQMIAARRALVDEGDYFELLGLARVATGYDVRRAFLELRRQFEPSRVLTPATLDLREDIELINDVLVEAYEILKDATRRERYRRALESSPQA